MQLCVPNSQAESKGRVLQIATHGEHYDSRYWDSKLNPEKHSYVEASLRAGYSILTWDRPGAGLSEHPDASLDAQVQLQLEVMHQLTLMAKNGSLYDAAGEIVPKTTAFKSVGTPEKIVHVGHSFGSFFTSAFIAAYPDLSDAAIITGFILNEHLGAAGTAAFQAEYAAAHGYDLPSGYMISIHSITC